MINMTKVNALMGTTKRKRVDPKVQDKIVEAEVQARVVKAKVDQNRQATVRKFTVTSICACVVPRVTVVNSNMILRS